MSDQLRELLVKTLYKAISPNFEVTFAEGYEPAADALLALFDVEDQWGVTWPPTGDVDWFDGEAEAREQLAFRAKEVPDLVARTKLVRRFVLTTELQPVTEKDQPDAD